ncbi:hypothetical protein DRN32_01765 [Thermococci archaeon]|nr:MAG: hypothetical protein DRN32_01765 [Thermococci archaeon]RLI16664.1 MAG: hypothetical protein DRO41_01010 [Candidatus Bathyarchaeota archaeon]
MTVKELAKLLSNLKPELQDKEVKVPTPSGYLPATVKFHKKTHDFSLTKESVEFVVVTYAGTYD